MDQVWNLLAKELFDLPRQPDTFNPYTQVNPEVDRPDAAQVRRANRRSYLNACQQHPDLFLLAEAPGPWGCRFSGVPITSEA